MNKAIVTLAVGERHQHLWNTFARASWERYAARHGYRLIIFDRLLDASPRGLERSPSWQKLLVLGQPELRGADRVLWLDADIVINDAAPSAIDGVPDDKIGAVQDQYLLSHPSLASAFAANNGWTRGPAALSRMFYTSNGLRPPCDYHLNGGVLIASPRHHRELFEHIYRSYEQTPHSYFEQAALSYEILTRGLHGPVDPRFNMLWLESKVAFYSFLVQLPMLSPLCIAAALRDAFFLHFAGHVQDMQWSDPRVKVDFGNVSLPVERIRQIADGWRHLLPGGS